MWWQLMLQSQLSESSCQPGLHREILSGVGGSCLGGEGGELSIFSPDPLEEESFGHLSSPRTERLGSGH